MKNLFGIFLLVSAFTMFFTSCDKAGDAVAGTKQLTELKDTLGGLTSGLGGIKDAESAEAAKEKLSAGAESLSGIAGGLDKLPEGVRGKVTSLIGEKSGGILEKIESVKALPGVGDKIGPVLEKITGALGKFK